MLALLSEPGRAVPVATGVKRIVLELRLKQIRFTTTAVLMLSRVPRVASFIPTLRSWSAVRKVFDVLVGYRRVFTSLPEASVFASRFITVGHDSPVNASLHLGLSKTARASDYPVLFYLDRLLAEPTSLFDLGGNVGNLYYCYQQYLDLSPSVRWIVYDMPAMLTIGRELARDRNDDRITFTDQLMAIGAADILLASGSLHYFEFDLPDLLRELPHKPRHLLINRSPFTNRRPVVTVQDATAFLVACKQICRADLIRGLQELNYELVDSWPVPELSQPIPFYPDYSLPQYYGLYFRLKPGTF